MKRLSVCSLITSATVLLPPSFGRAAGDETPVIRDIEVRTLDVFDDGDGEEVPDQWLFRTGNRLHLETREEVVRRELLFSVGEALNAESLEQTERNLRLLPFLRDARVEVDPAGDGLVDVRVTTWDVWSTVPEIRLGKVGNEWLWTVGAVESNLLGRGKQVELARRKNLDRKETYLSYRDPRIFGSRLDGGTILSSRSDGHRVQLDLGRPFFALDTTWAFVTLFEDFDQLDPIYEDGERIAELRHSRRRVDLSMARAAVKRPASSLRIHLGYRFLEDDLEVDFRRFGILQVGLTAVQHRFLKLTHVNRFERVEDFNLGSVTSVFVGVSTEALGGEPGTTTFYNLSQQAGLGVGREGFLLGRASWRARHRRDRLENSLARFRLSYTQKLSRRNVLLGSATLVYGHELDPELQVRLGAESGLRGYPVRQFNGDRSLLLKAEQRFYLADDLARLVSFGAAIFVDSGFAWPEGEPLVLSDLRTNVGASLLIGRNRLSARAPGVRVDIAYALQPIEGRSPWLVSFGSMLGFP